MSMQRLINKLPHMANWLNCSARIGGASFSVRVLGSKTALSDTILHFLNIALTLSQNVKFRRNVVLLKYIQCAVQFRNILKIRSVTYQSFLFTQFT